MEELELLMESIHDSQEAFRKFKEEFERIANDELERKGIVTVNEVLNKMNRA